MAEVLGTVASILQLVDTALRAREYIKDFQNAPAEQRKLFSDIEDLKLLLVELEKRTKASPSTGVLQHMQRPLGDFKALLEKFVAKFEQPDSRLGKLSKQLTWALWNKIEATEFLKKFEAIKLTLNTWLTMGIWDTNQDHKQDHEAQERREEERRNEVEAEKQQILDWITSLNFFQRQADILAAWQPGTGEWLLTDARFKSWESGGQQVLWCYGIPGAGKTVISAMVVNHLQSKFKGTDSGVACIYLNHKETASHTLVNLLASIWKQLAVGKPLALSVHTLYRHHRERNTSPSEQEVAEILHNLLAQMSQVYLVIDALDEYPEQQRWALMDQLSRILGPTMRLMLTSRPHLEFNDIFPDLLAVEIRAADEDILSYIDKQINLAPRLSKHVRGQPKLRDEIKACIMSKVDGMFLLAKLHVGSLSSKNTVKAVRQALPSLPQTLDQTYEEAIARILSQSSEDKELALRTLTWVAYTKRPLAVAELLEALAIEPGAAAIDTDNLLDISIVLAV
ncbi:hypothetical protein B0H15DRAFT_1004565, partial [Mycena belliarum]